MRNKMYILWTPCGFLQTEKVSVFSVCLWINWLIWTVYNAGCPESLMDWCDWMIGRGSASPEAHHCVFSSLIKAGVDLMNSERSLLTSEFLPQRPCSHRSVFFKSTALLTGSSQVCGGERLYGGLFKSSLTMTVALRRERERETSGPYTIQIPYTHCFLLP